MATGKKFYWIKLKKDFMTGDAVDFLMSQRNGAQYVVLYQMLCLMCINTGGRLSRRIGEVIIPFDVDKIQRDCKYFSRDTVSIALGLFKKLGLIYEQDECGLAISDFESLIGSETDYARQKRIQRKGGQIQGQLADNSADNVHDDVQGQSVDNTMDNVHQDVPELSIQSKSIEKEIRDKSTEIRDQSSDTEENTITISNEIVCQTDVRRIIQSWNGLQNCGIKPVSKLDSNSKRYGSLAARIKQYSVADVLEAIERIKSSDFLQGKNSNGWTITFDWFVRPNNFPKVLEGNYDNKDFKGGGENRSSYAGKIENRVSEVDNW